MRDDSAIEAMRRLVNTAGDSPGLFAVGESGPVDALRMLLGQRPLPEMEKETMDEADLLRAIAQRIAEKLGTATHEDLYRQLVAIEFAVDIMLRRFAEDSEHKQQFEERLREHGVEPKGA